MGQEDRVKIGEVIDKFNTIEYYVCLVIEKYFKPQNGSDFRSLLLNNSVMNFGAKIKVLANITDLPSKNIQSLRKLNGIRNGLAHNLPKYTIQFDKRLTPVNPDLEPGPVNVLVMNAEGKLVPKDFDYEYQEFLRLSVELRDVLLAQLGAFRNPSK